MAKAVTSAEDLIKKHEDGQAWTKGPPAVWTVYKDNAKKKNPTIGWGHKLPKDTDITEITNAQANEYFNGDYAKAAADAAEFVSNYSSLSMARQAVLIDMEFNLGKAGLQGFKKFHKALELSDWEEAANQMVHSDWYDQTGNRATEDVAIMRSGSF